MAYVRARGNQLAIVQWEREPETGKVEQRILCTLYSKAGALEALGRGDEHGAKRFRQLLEGSIPTSSSTGSRFEKESPSASICCRNFINTSLPASAADSGRTSAPSPVSSSWQTPRILSWPRSFSKSTGTSYLTVTS